MRRPSASADDAVMLSQLFAGDALLADIAGDNDRISRTQHQDHPAVAKVQTALLLWDPGCLPNFGVDGNYGDEAAGAVARFKREELGVPADEVIDDVGPQTVQRLDRFAAAAEAAANLGFVAVASIEATGSDLAGLRIMIEQVGGEILQGLGEHAAIISGGPEVIEALTGLVGSVLTGLVTAQSPQLPDGTDEDTAVLISAWLAMIDPASLFAHADPERFGMSFAALGNCLVVVDQ
jgi:peptidoglycan hydrolase-like protein with peptidoglycan-binding domain